MAKKDYREMIYGDYVRLQAGKLHTHSKEEYERFAKFYTKKYAKLLPKDKNAKILDVGCGPGFFLYFLKKLGYKNAIGIDLGNEQLELAKSYGLNVQSGNMFDFLPEHCNEFEFIFSSHVIEHLRKDEVIDFLQSIRNSLKHDGRVVVCTPNANSLFGFAYHCGDLTHETPFTPFCLKAVMQACGFKSVVVRPEWPVAVDIQSTIRVVLWNIIKPVIKAVYIVTSGTDLMKTGDVLFENYFFATGEKE